MTDAKRLLAEATPLPWWLDDDGTIRSDHGEIGYIDVPDGPIVVYAVNRLPDYLAAVDGLGVLLEAHGCLASDDCGDPRHNEAREALARLRDEVPA